jgi:hypothetical protein
MIGLKQKKEAINTKNTNNKYKLDESEVVVFSMLAAILLFIITNSILNNWPLNTFQTINEHIALITLSIFAIEVIATPIIINKYFAIRE